MSIMGDNQTVSRKELLMDIELLVVIPVYDEEAILLEITDDHMVLLAADP